MLRVCIFIGDLDDFLGHTYSIKMGDKVQLIMCSHSNSNTFTITLSGISRNMANTCICE